MGIYRALSCVSLTLLFSGHLLCSSDDLPKIGGLDTSMPEDYSRPESPREKQENSKMWLIPAGIATVSAAAACYYCVKSYCYTKIEAPKQSIQNDLNALRKVPSAIVEVAPYVELEASDKTTTKSSSIVEKRIISEEFITYTEHRRIVNYADFTYFPEEFEKKQNKEL